MNTSLTRKIKNASQLETPLNETRKYDVVKIRLKIGGRRGICRRKTSWMGNVKEWAN